jgi:hypothetical protein
VLFQLQFECKVYPIVPKVVQREANKQQYGNTFSQGSLVYTLKAT